MKFTIGTVSNFQEYEKDLQLIKSSLLYADEIELIGLTEYAVFKYLPVVMDGGKDLASLISGLLPFLRSIEITNKDDMLQQLEYAQSQLQIYSPILKKKKRRTTVELQAQLKIKQVQKEIKDKLEEAMAQLITQPSSLELQGLVEKGIVSIFDYQMQSMNTDEMTGGYFGKMMNAIYAANTFPLFDDISAGLVQSIAQAKLIDISKLDGEVLRHAGVASRILMTLPTLESASYDELLDFKSQNSIPLARFRKAIYDFSEKISSLPWDKEFQYECIKLYDTEVAPKVAEINELFTETSTLKNFGKKVLADEELRKDAGFVAGGLATAITTSATLSGLLHQFLITVSLAVLSKEAGKGFLRVADLWVQGHDEAKKAKKQGSDNVMYYYYLASKRL
jgi:hypothetical protein